MTNDPWGGGIPNDPGQYPGRPSPGAGFFHLPGCESAHGGPCYCFGNAGANPNARGPQYTPEQREAQTRVNRLRISNLILFFPFAFFTLLAIGYAAIPAQRHQYNEFLPGAIALIILVFVIRNKVMKYRVRHHHHVR
jgi:hypothetical protein